MTSRSVKKNAVLNIIQSISSVFFPLITFPYVSRVLGVDNIGAYNFSQTYVYYFSFLAGLGISTYAIREGARIREKRDELDRFASDIFSINVFSTIVSCIILALLMVAVPKLREYHIYILILSIQIVFTTLGKNWVFSIFEDYFFVSIRNILCQIIALVAMFAFVKDQDDLIYYCLVSLSAKVISETLNLFYARKYCRITFGLSPDLSHLKPILLIFSMSISVVIYSNVDITLLGFFGTDYNVGLYGVSVKVYTIVKQVIAAGLTVTIPRFSYYLGNKDRESYSLLYDKTYNSILIVLIPAVCGMTFLSKEIVTIISGIDYIEAAPSLSILSLSMFFNLITYLLGYCILIPNRDEKSFFYATVGGAISNVLLNLVLIPLYYQNAAAFTTLVSEAVAMGICYYRARKYFCYKYINKNFISVCIGTGLVFLICVFTKHAFSSDIVTLVGAIVLSLIVYSAFQIAIKNIYFTVVVKQVLARVKRK